MARAFVFWPYGNLVIGGTLSVALVITFRLLVEQTLTPIGTAVRPVERLSTLTSPSAGSATPNAITNPRGAVKPEPLRQPA